MEKKQSIASGLVWKLLERFGVQGMSFLVSLLLARLLDPEHYGTLSMMTIFTYLAQVFIQNGFNTALIQKKNATEEDYSSVLWVTMGVTGLVYGALFICAPYIGSFYNMPDFAAPFRILALMLFPGALNSIQLAVISRRMDFKKVFYSSIAAISLSGITGITLAYMGAGVWALVAQNLVNVSVTCFVMWFTVKWRPMLICNMERVGSLFSYGWKMLVSGLLDALYSDINALVIGRKYDAGTLGFYNRGKQFPQFLIDGINGAVQSVLLPAMANEQDDKVKVKELTHNSVMLSSYVIFPIMAGLAGVAEPLVRILLTDKWLPCVPYLQIACFTFAFYPVHTSNLQAIKAMGRSDIFLKLEVIKKTYGLIALVIAVVCFDSPLAIAMNGAITTVLSFFVNAGPNKKLIGYTYTDQVRDILPYAAASVFMLVGVRLVGRLVFNDLIILVLQVISGVALYVIISITFRMRPFWILFDMIKALFIKQK